MLQAALDIAIIVTLWASVGGHSMANAPSTVLMPLRRRALVLRVLALDVVVIPLATTALVRWLGIDDDVAIGLILFGAASAGVIGLVAVQTARGDMVLALTLVAVLEVVNVVAVPVWSALLLPHSVEVPVGQVARVLVVYILLPTVIGITVRELRPRTAERLVAPARTVALVGLVAVVLLVVARDAALFGRVIGAGVPVVALVMGTAAMAGGWFVAGGDRGTRIAVALVTAQRGSAVSLAVAVASFPESPGAAVAVVVAALVTLLMTSSVAAVLGMRPRMPVAWPVVRPRS